MILMITHDKSSIHIVGLVRASKVDTWLNKETSQHKTYPNHGNHNKSHKSQFILERARLSQERNVPQQKHPIIVNQNKSKKSQFSLEPAHLIQ